jgi:hypothetical protein
MFVHICANTGREPSGVSGEAGLEGGNRVHTLPIPPFQSPSHRFVLGNGLYSANPARSSSPTKHAGASFSSHRTPPDLHHVTIGTRVVLIRGECGQTGNMGILMGLECEIALEATLPFLGGSRGACMDETSVYKCLA